MSADTARRGDVADAAVGDGGVDALTMDGGIITIRAIHDSDRDRLAVLYRDANARLAPAGAEPDPTLRRLRPV
jgi:hypothetical protein